MKNFAICEDNLKNTEIPEGKNVQLGSIRREVSEVEKAWLAAAIEGEGYVGIVQHYDRSGKGLYTTARISITNGNLLFIKKVSEIFYGLNSVFYFQLRKGKKTNHQSRLDIIAEGQGSCLKIVEAIYPYLASKKDQVNTLREFILWRMDKKFDNQKAIEFRDRISLLKHNHPDPSQTTRRASKPLILDGDIVGTV
jgi:hypothetical protein